MGGGDGGKGTVEHTHTQKRGLYKNPIVKYIALSAQFKIIKERKSDGETGHGDPCLQSQHLGDSQGLL